LARPGTPIRSAWPCVEQTGEDLLDHFLLPDYRLGNFLFDPGSGLPEPPDRLDIALRAHATHVFRLL